MSHSTVIALALIALFFVYVTSKGELPQYLATILGPFPSETPPTTASSVLGQVGQATTLAGSAAQLASQANVVFGGSSGSLDVGGSDSGNLDIGGA